MPQQLRKLKVVELSCRRPLHCFANPTFSEAFTHSFRQTGDACLADLLRTACDTSIVTNMLNVETDNLQYYEHQSTSLSRSIAKFNCQES